MKRTLALLLLTLLLCAGCVVYCGSPAPHTSQYTVVNGTSYRLDVYQDGEALGTLGVGQVMPVYGTLLWQRTVVTVVARETSGNYVGTSSWIYEYGVPEAWTVCNLTRPEK